MKNSFYFLLLLSTFYYTGIWWQTIIFDFLTFFYTFYSSKMGWHRNLLHFMLYWNWITKKYSTLSALVLYVIVYWKRMEISSLLSALVIFFILYWNWMTKKSSLLSPDAPPDHCSNSTTNNPHQLCVLDKKEKVTCRKNIIP